MKHPVEPKVLRLRERESVHRLDVFLKCNAPRFIARGECFRLLCRLVGDQNWQPNLKTVLYVIGQYTKYHWERHEFGLWLFSQRKIYHRTNEQIDAILGCEFDPEEEEWPEVVEEAKR